MDVFPSHRNFVPPRRTSTIACTSNATRDWRLSLAPVFVEDCVVAEQFSVEMKLGRKKLRVAMTSCPFLLARFLYLQYVGWGIFTFTTLRTSRARVWLFGAQRRNLATRFAAPPNSKLEAATRQKWLCRLFCFHLFRLLFLGERGKGERTTQKSRLILTCVILMLKWNHNGLWATLWY